MANRGGSFTLVRGVRMEKLPWFQEFAAGRRDLRRHLLGLPRGLPGPGKAYLCR